MFNKNVQQNLFDQKGMKRNVEKKKQHFQLRNFKSNFDDYYN